MLAVLHVGSLSGGSLQTLQFLVHAVRACYRSRQFGIGGAQPWSALCLWPAATPPCRAACDHKQMCWTVPVDTDVEVSIAGVGCGQHCSLVLRLTHCSLLVRLRPGDVLHCRFNGKRLAAQPDGQFLAQDEVSPGELLVHLACAPSPCLATNRGSASLPPTASALPQSGRELR